jgi:LPS-assembly lipoprotein
MSFFNIARLSLLTLALVSLTSCGFRMQGVRRLPAVMSVTYIDSSDRYSDFTRALGDSIRATGARVAETRAEATAIVRVRKDETGQSVLSVSARNTPEELEVFYKVEYSVEAVENGPGAGQELIPAQTLVLTRDYNYDERALLAKQRERAVLQQSLARDLADIVLRRLVTL